MRKIVRTIGNISHVHDVEDKALVAPLMQYDTPAADSDATLIGLLAHRQSRDFKRLFTKNNCNGVLAAILPGTHATASTVTINPTGFAALLDGDVVTVSQGTTRANDFTTPVALTLGPPPASGTRTDIIWLEAWYAQVAAPSASDGSDLTIRRHGDATAAILTNDLQNPDLGVESVRAIQRRYRLRYAEGFSVLAGRFAQGGAIAISTTISYVNEGGGLYIAGTGSVGDADQLLCVDGYTYAIPLVLVTQRAGVTAIAGADITAIGDTILKIDPSILPPIGSAGNADTVDGFHANAAPTANTLLPLDAANRFNANSMPLLGIQATNLADGSVINAKLGALAVTAAKIADLTVTTGKLADLLITTTKLADLSVTTAKLAALAVDSSKLGTGAVTAEKIGAQQITADKISTGAVGQGLTGGGGVPLRVRAIPSQFGFDGVGDLALAPNGIPEAAIAPNAVSPRTIDPAVAGAGLSGGNGTALSVNVLTSQFGFVGDQLALASNGIPEAAIAPNAISSRTIDPSVAGAGLSGGNGTPLALNTFGAQFTFVGDQLAYAANGIPEAALAPSAVSPRTVSTAVAGSGLSGGNGAALSVNVGEGIEVVAGTLLRTKIFCSWRMAVAQTVAYAVVTSLKYDTIVSDVKSLCSTNLGYWVFTAPVAGIYLFNCDVGFPSQQWDAGSHATLQFGGSARRFPMSYSANMFAGLGGSGIVEMTAGQQYGVSLYVARLAGGAVSTVVETSSWTNVQVTRVG